MQTTLSLSFPSLKRLCLLHAGLSFMEGCAESFETRIPEIDCGVPLGFLECSGLCITAQGVSQECAWVAGGRSYPERRQWVVVFFFLPFSPSCPSSPYLHHIFRYYWVWEAVLGPSSLNWAYWNNLSLCVANSSEPWHSMDIVRCHICNCCAICYFGQWITFKSIRKAWLDFSTFFVVYGFLWN